jgi:DNA-binding NtrC family response regulator
MLGIGKTTLYRKLQQYQRAAAKVPNQKTSSRTPA